MIVRRHLKQGRLFLAICDTSLLGKVLEDEHAKLDLSADYFKGKDVDEENAWEQVKVAEMTHCVGKEAVAFFLSKGLLPKENVKTVQGIPHFVLYRY